MTICVTREFAEAIGLPFKVPEDVFGYFTTVASMYCVKISMGMLVSFCSIHVTPFPENELCAAGRKVGCWEGLTCWSDYSD